MANENYWTDTEHRIVHHDGWLYSVNDIDEGMLRLSYKEFVPTEKQYKTVDSVDITTDSLPELIKALQFFVDREVK